MTSKIVKGGKGFRKAFAKQLLKLVTSAFGLVAALAWNEVIKEAVDVYVKPVAGKTSSLVGLLIYAFVVTTLAVFVTYYLTKVVGKDTN